MKRPPEQTPPSHVHWDEWIGPAPFRPYAVYEEGKGRHRGAYHDFNWRGWWDFGTGALGDMACHTANLPFRALQLTAPTSAVAKAGDVNSDTYPTWATVTFQFPARGDWPALTFNWYEGRKDGKKLSPPKELLEKILKPGEKLSGSGSIMVGDQGILFSPDDYGIAWRL